MPIFALSGRIDAASLARYGECTWQRSQRRSEKEPNQSDEASDATGRRCQLRLRLIDLATDGLPSQETLEVLLEHGWDINNRTPGLSGTPILWYVVRDTDLVK